MCGRNLLSWALLVFSLQVSYGQSFQDSKVYQVEGKKLNELEMNLKTAKSELENQKQDLERLSNLLKFSDQEIDRLKTWLEESQRKEQELTLRLAQVNKSYQTLQNSTMDNDEAALLGIALGVIVTIGIQYIFNGGK